MVQKVFSLVGPTAVGKTELSLRLAEELDAEIINADALQVYRGLNIGTAKPTPAEQQRISHHLIDILDPSQTYSAGAFADLARGCIDDIGHRGRRALIVGGSGLYQRALLWGIAQLPPRDADIHQRLQRKLDELGPAWASQRLREIDAASAERINVNDMQRTIRALEVYESTGRTLSEHLAAQPFRQRGLPAVRVGLECDRTVLYKRIEDRVDQMFALGWVAEVESLLEAGVEIEAPAFQAIGYRQIISYLRRETTLEAARDGIVRATRRYAKRQLTWFRKEDDISWFSTGEPNDQTASFSAIMSHFRSSCPSVDRR